MKNILIPTDFSENAMNAIRYCLEFFKHHETNFFFVHAYEDEVYNNHELLEEETFEEVRKMVSHQTELKLEMLLKEVKAIAPPESSFKYHTVSAYNSLLDEVDKLVIGKAIDLVVMGTKGESSQKSFAFGSQTLQVLKYASAPVLAIPQYYDQKQPKQVLFPTDFLIPFKRRELKLLSTLLSPFKSKLELLYISEAKQFSKRQKTNMEFLKHEIPENKLNFKTIAGKNVIEVINHYVEANAIDLLVMVNTRHSFLEDMLFRSKLDAVFLNADIPFLVLQNVRRTA